MLSLDEFLALRENGYTHVPLWQTLPLPEGVDALALYQALANRGQDYLFETGHWKDGAFAQEYSVIGLPCVQRIELDEGRFRVLRDGQLWREVACEDPLLELARLQKAMRVPHFGELPRFSGGLFGYFGFETTSLFEPRLRRTPRKPSGFALPDVVQWVSTELVVLDHHQGLAFCIAHASTDAPADYRHSVQRLETLSALLRPLLQPAPPRRAHVAAIPPTPEFAFPRSAFETAVARVKDYIAAGDVMQVVLSQRMNLPFQEDALALYRALSGLGRTPYRYLLHLGDCQVVGASPEMLFRQDEDRVTSRPMAGTCRRGAESDEDRRLRDALLSNPKEVAEHMMLVDLARNDIGRLAEPGSVTVEQLLGVEYFSHVMHLVSTVSGRMPGTVGGLDLLRSTFPAGTLSGASKIRALEVIAELEPHSRGVYGGAIGYLNWRGHADLAITIRTALLRQGQLYVQAGAGVVQDSVAEREWQETLEKSQMMRLAASLCRDGATHKETLACIC